MNRQNQTPEQSEFNFLGIIKQKCTNPSDQSLQQTKMLIGFSKWIAVLIGVLITLVITVLIIWGPKIDSSILAGIATTIVTSTIGITAKNWFKSKKSRSP